jgi:hypothetical protein
VNGFAPHAFDAGLTIGRAVMSAVECLVAGGLDRPSALASFSFGLGGVMTSRASECLRKSLFSATLGTGSTGTLTFSSRPLSERERISTRYSVVKIQRSGGVPFTVLATFQRFSESGRSRTVFELDRSKVNNPPPRCYDTDDDVYFSVGLTFALAAVGLFFFLLWIRGQRSAQGDKTERVAADGSSESSSFTDSSGTDTYADTYTDTVTTWNSSDEYYY